MENKSINTSSLVKTFKYSLMSSMLSVFSVVKDISLDPLLDLISFY